VSTDNALKPFSSRLRDIRGRELRSRLASLYVRDHRIIAGTPEYHQIEILNERGLTDLLAEGIVADDLANTLAELPANCLRTVDFLAVPPPTLGLLGGLVLEVFNEWRREEKLPLVALLPLASPQEQFMIEPEFANGEIKNKQVVIFNSCQATGATIQRSGSEIRRFGGVPLAGLVILDYALKPLQPTFPVAAFFRRAVQVVPVTNCNICRQRRAN
jgi:hypothetical protein